MTSSQLPYPSGSRPWFKAEWTAMGFLNIVFLRAKNLGAACKTVHARLSGKPEDLSVSLVISVLEERALGRMDLKVVVW